jgi:hypothetical protein
MKFGKIVKDVLENQKLQKVRIKVDPIWAKNLGYHTLPSFEGYVLQESHQCSTPVVKVFIINAPPGFESVQNVKPENIETVENPDELPKTYNVSKLTMLKKAILDKAIEMGKEKDDPDIVQILNSKDIGFIETFLRQMGLTEEDLLNLYRKCFKKV